LIYFFEFQKGVWDWHLGTATIRYPELTKDLLCLRETSLREPEWNIGSTLSTILGYFPSPCPTSSICAAFLSGKLSFRMTFWCSYAGWATCTHSSFSVAKLMQSICPMLASKLYPSYCTNIHLYTRDIARQHHTGYILCNQIMFNKSLSASNVQTLPNCNNQFP